MRSIWFLVALFLLLWPCLAETAESVLIDRILAVLDGAVIAQSDLEVAKAFGLFRLDPWEPGAKRTLSRVDLDRYLEGRLLLADAKRLALSVPAPEVEAVWEALIKRAGEQRVQQAMAQDHLTPGDLKKLLQEDLLIQRFIALRFRAFVEVSDFEVEEYLRQNRLASLTAEERAIVAEYLLAQKIEARLKEWVAHEQTRVSLTILMEDFAP